MKTLATAACVLLLLACGSDADSESDPDSGASEPGSVIISEIMVDPAAVPDANGEWIELYNPTSAAIDLAGLVVRDDGTDAFTIGSSVIVPARGYVVLGRDGNSPANGIVALDYKYEGFSLANTEDEVDLFLDGKRIDRVAYGDTFPLVTGAAMSLAPGGDAASNDHPGNWCAASPVYGAGDHGTPGAVNPTC